MKIEGEINVHAVCNNPCGLITIKPIKEHKCTRWLAILKTSACNLKIIQF